MRVWSAAACLIVACGSPAVVEDATSESAELGESVDGIGSQDDPPAPEDSDSADTPPTEVDETGYRDLEEVILPEWASQPCVITASDVGGDCFYAHHIQVGGLPMTLCAPWEPIVLEYDTLGRVVFDGERRYEHLGDGTALVTEDGEEPTTATFDAYGRIVSLDETMITYDDDWEMIRTLGETTFTYDDDGRMIRREREDGYFVAFEFHDDGTMTPSHNYPDMWEHCESRLLEVTRDAEGRVASESYGGCMINEPERVLRYTYDRHDRIIEIVDEPDYAAYEIATISIDYSCHGSF